MITHISEKESQVTHMLTVCNEALREVTKERDRLATELLAAMIRIENDAMELAKRSSNENHA